MCFHYSKEYVYELRRPELLEAGDTANDRLMNVLDIYTSPAAAGQPLRLRL